MMLEVGTIPQGATIRAALDAFAAPDGPVVVERNPDGSASADYTRFDGAVAVSAHLVRVGAGWAVDNYETCKTAP